MLSVGSELRTVLKAWELALKNVPDDWLSRAYEHATENFNWDGKPFGPHVIAQAYRELLEDKQRAEVLENRPCRRDDTYKCWHCQDIGYQLVWVFTYNRWYSSQRPCSCDLAPLGQRSPAPLEPDMFARNENGEYAQRSEIEKHGAPPKFFKESHA